MLRKLILYAALPLAILGGASAARADDTQVVAVRVGYVNGALICPTGSMIDVAMDLLREDALLQAVGPQARKNWEAMYGHSPADLSSIGCAVAPPGTHLRITEELGHLYHVVGNGYNGYATEMGLARVR